MLEGRLGKLTAQSITRLLLISYFAAMAIGLIDGGEITSVLNVVLPAPQAEWAMRGIVLVLCLLILSGIGRRPAALVLSLIVFFSSYIALYAGGEINIFWRDLALIGGLLMTADIANPVSQEVNWADAEVEGGPPRPKSYPPEPVDPLVADTQFRQDLKIARAN